MWAQLEVSNAELLLVMEYFKVGIITLHWYESYQRDI